jgi:hypothetical protein
MSGFSTQWLAMRESADAQARSDGPVDALNHWSRDRSALNIIDLGCGSGSNLRWLAPRLAARQNWHLFDDDPLLLSQAGPSLHDWASIRSEAPRVIEQLSPALRIAQVDGADAFALGAGLTAHLAQCDLSRQFPALHDADLLCASALLDLVSKDWLSALLARCAQAQVAVYFALSYDGRARFSPAHADDAMIRDAINRDQCADKGFGPALGPDCIAVLNSQCQTHGYRVQQWRSDWQLGADESFVHAQLITDFAQIAARNVPRDLQARVLAWQGWRRENLNRSSLLIGHVDALALPWNSRTDVASQAGEDDPHALASPAPSSS